MSKSCSFSPEKMRQKLLAQSNQRENTRPSINKWPYAQHRKCARTTARSIVQCAYAALIGRLRDRQIFGDKVDNFISS